MMSYGLVNLLTFWALVISPLLCVAGILPNDCQDPKTCEVCTDDCTPHSTRCPEDNCHLDILQTRDPEHADLGSLPNAGPTQPALLPIDIAPLTAEVATFSADLREYITCRTDAPIVGPLLI